MCVRTATATKLERIILSFKYAIRVESQCGTSLCSLWSTLLLRVVPFCEIHWRLMCSARFHLPFLASGCNGCRIIRLTAIATRCCSTTNSYIIHFAWKATVGTENGKRHSQPVNRCTLRIAYNTAFNLDGSIISSR